MKIIYLAGPVRANEHKTKEENIETARKFVSVFIENEIPYYSPHMNIDHLNIQSSENSFAWNLDFEFLERSDALAVLPGWENSNGTKKEIEYAKSKSLPIFYLDKDGAIQEIIEWLK